MFDYSTIQREVFERSVMFKTLDGAALVGRMYRPQGRPVAAVVLNSATGVPQSMYTHFARWLAAERGMACLTYDYRDIGRSVTGSLRSSKADMLDWGITDQIAARQAMRRGVPDAPLWVLGHSLGALLLPNQPQMEDVARVIAVASGMTHYSGHPWPSRATILAFWFAIGPLAAALFGYLPAKRLGFGEDLPAGAYWQWRRWCTSRDPFARDVGVRLQPANWTSPASVRLVAFADDVLVPPASVWRLADSYGAGAERVMIDPSAHGLQNIGHMGAFSRRNKALWPKLVDA